MSGSHSRQAADNESDEHRPFLPGNDEPQRQRPRTRAGLIWLVVLFALAAASVFALAAVLLRFPASSDSASSQPTSPETTDRLHGSQAIVSSPPQATQVHDDNADTAVIVHQDQLPSIPRLRNPDAYVLDASAWNLTTSPMVREFNWTIQDAVLNPDGVFRPMILINNQFPGPLVECNQGDTLVVHVHNKATNATAIHFHGLWSSNWEDGAVGITQCPIAPGSSFIYRIRVPSRQPAGTYWYHGHHSAQASDGLLGPLIIHGANENRADYASDRVLMVQDHYHNTTSQLLAEYLQPDHENNEPVPDNPLINGHGFRNCSDFVGWRCNNTDTNRPVIDLVPSARHRLRIINVGAFAEFQIQVDEHPFYVTEVDGTDVHPEPFHRLNVLPAQRYSIVIETNVTSTVPAAYWLRARMVTHCFATKNPRLQPELWAVLRYAVTSPQDLPVELPHSKEWPEAAEVICRDLNTTALRPVHPMKPPPADDFVALRGGFRINDWRVSHGFFNDSSWQPNATYPSLHRFLDASPEAQQASMNASVISANNHTFDRGKELVMQTSDVRTIDISINNFDDGAHPFHVHGHSFFIVAQGSSGYPPRADQWPAYLEALGGVPDNPLRRDTVTVESFAWVIIRVVLDNPGLWAFHCHNTWHAEAGMVMQLLARADIVRGWKVDAHRRAMCSLDGASTGMRPDDSIWGDPFQ
ncbi:hypothetical protein HIM_07061 [Hirsutella minnesotensis 3608]|uniref:Multicopper oxidase n=1 Tax=Hirsutella minnesotensis 3608 TaxID=1043627 RepID=A0A0F7ZNC4_9HYPO|nr:hypothetical protein HIM_07061 [Hirsutella minnesotensis 3608]